MTNASILKGGYFDFFLKDLLFKKKWKKWLFKKKSQNLYFSFLSKEDGNFPSLYYDEAESDDMAGNQA